MARMENQQQDFGHRIDVAEHEERRCWAKRFGVSEDRLLRAVQEVGPLALDVAATLGAGKFDLPGTTP